MYVLQKPTVTAGMLTWCSWPPWRGPSPSPACCSGSSTAGSHPTGSALFSCADSVSQCCSTGTRPASGSCPRPCSQTQAAPRTRKLYISLWIKPSVAGTAVQCSVPPLALRHRLPPLHPGQFCRAVPCCTGSGRRRPSSTAPVSPPRSSTWRMSSSQGSSPSRFALTLNPG